MVTRRKALLMGAGGLLTAATAETAWTAQEKINSDGHPRILVRASDRDAIRAKITQAPWAKAAFTKLKGNVDHFVTLTEKDPQFVTSRLLMNWQTRYTQPIVEKERWVRGEGRAPVPTPRFAGARDWESRFTMPATIDGFRPYNDAPDGSSNVWLLDKNTKKGEWTPPGITGRNIEVANQRIIQLAADAAFVHWVTGEEKYAVFAGDILWTYLDGFQHVTLARPLDDKTRVIGYTSFEVIHEGILPPLALCYDFLHDYLQKRGRSVALIQAQLKRMSDRIIEGGNPDGNWNLNQAIKFVYPALALEDDRTYADKKGRQYYVDILLNARLPAQTGLVHVIKEGYDAVTALWPEAPGYGFGTTPQIVQIASLAGAHPAGKAILEDPFLARAALVQGELLHPNGYSIGLGDTTNARANANALELLIASARKRGDVTTEDRLTAALRGEIESGRYNRGAQADMDALTQYVTDLRPISAASGEMSRTYFGTPLNVFMQRSPAAKSTHALSAALYGTKGGHVHANGMAMELYGAGLILGADPGRGASYWTVDHRDYYKQPVAHNTVVVNGAASYAENKKPQKEIAFVRAEPASGASALSPTISFAAGTFGYDAPQAEQQRTLALVRTSPTSGFYWDVFRSRTAAAPAGNFHDYVYHNMGQSAVVTDETGKPLPLAPTTHLASEKLAKGYAYLKNERSVTSASDVQTVFTTKMPGGADHVMSLWMLGGAGRQVFRVDAPPNRAIRDALPIEFSTMPMPTLLVRQTGEAWERPFVAVYEPYLGAEGAVIKRARSAQGDGKNLAACIVEGIDFSVLLLESDTVTSHRVEGAVTFQGSFGIVRYRKGQVEEIYLGSGARLGTEALYAASTGSQAIGASLRRVGGAWQYSASSPVRVRLSFSALPEGVKGKLVCHDAKGREQAVSLTPSHPVAGENSKTESAFEGTLPAGFDSNLTLVKA